MKWKTMLKKLYVDYYDILKTSEVVDFKNFKTLHNKIWVGIEGRDLSICVVTIPFNSPKSYRFRCASGINEIFPPLLF